VGSLKKIDHYVEGIVGVGDQMLHHNFVLSYVNIKVNLNLRNKHVLDPHENLVHF